MHFYHTPGSSSQASHIMLREAAIDFRPHKVDIFNHVLEDGSDYRRINPNGYVPALVFEDGTLLTENVAILDWLVSKTGAFPSGNETIQRRHLQMLAFMSSEIHKPFIPLFFTEDEGERTRRRQFVEARLNWICAQVQGEHLIDGRFTGADAMLYVILRWCGMVGIAHPAGLSRFIKSVERRDAVLATLEAECLEPLGTAA